MNQSKMVKMSLKYAHRLRLAMKILVLNNMTSLVNLIQLLQYRILIYKL